MDAMLNTIRDIWQKSNPVCLFCKACSNPLEIGQTYGKLLIERCKLLSSKYSRQQITPRYFGKQLLSTRVN